MTTENKILESASLRQILDLLADGEFHSGEEIGQLLGVSRAAIWKHLQKLEVLGVALVSIKGRGYCIEGGLDLLDSQKIKAQLKSKLPLNLEVFAQIDSTNSYLMRQKNPALQVCFAESQTAGRGRRGRVWISPFAQNLYCSIGWGFEGGIAAIEGLSLAVGLAIVRTLQDWGIVGLRLKWPNDVLFENKKLAGVLVEVTGDPAGYCQVVIGLGLNLAMGDEQAGAIDQPWTDLRNICRQLNLAEPPRNSLAASVIDELVRVLDGYDRTGFAPYCAEWQSFNAHAGQQIELRNGNSIRSGLCVGVCADGALLVQTELGEERFHGGEITVRQFP
ncbi:MAG TPA: bifunctional biotin--[acetyl-CoA-carboxylase] ligase/biotin operon repressor BirA [Cellvibrio sp.]|nr:bifunctional biotin--[acetyl-CoA-carboxylase] ligase/biotin operon repressor BirA [Cellvibrio sp.]